MVSFLSLLLVLERGTNLANREIERLALPLGREWINASFSALCWEWRTHWTNGLAIIKGLASLKPFPIHGLQNSQASSFAELTLACCVLLAYPPWLLARFEPFSIFAAFPAFFERNRPNCLELTSGMEWKKGGTKELIARLSYVCDFLFPEKLQRIFLLPLLWLFLTHGFTQQLVGSGLNLGNSLGEWLDSTTKRNKPGGHLFLLLILLIGY